MTFHESDKVEFKESFDRDAAVTASAFSNTKGGTIFIGINEVVSQTPRNTFYRHNPQTFSQTDEI